jgi:hypothetical protein
MHMAGGDAQGGGMHVHPVLPPWVRPCLYGSWMQQQVMFFYLRTETNSTTVFQTRLQSADLNHFKIFSIQRIFDISLDRKNNVELQERVPRGG